MGFKKTPEIHSYSTNHQEYYSDTPTTITSPVPVCSPARGISSLLLYPQSSLLSILTSFLGHRQKGNTVKLKSISCYLCFQKKVLEVSQFRGDYVQVPEL